MCLQVREEVNFGIYYNCEISFIALKLCFAGGRSRQAAALGAQRTKTATETQGAENETTQSKSNVTLPQSNQYAIILFTDLLIYNY